MTGTVLFDSSENPPQKYGDDVWFSMFVPDEIGKLRRLRAAIEKWRNVADAEFEDFKTQCDQKRNPAWDEYGYDPTQDAAFVILETERVMFANLAVTIASTAENFIIGICKVRQISCEKNGKTDFSVALDSLGKAIGQTISELSGHAGNQRARLIGNCFKHTEGKTNPRFVDKFGGNLDEVIEYENEDWEQMIGDTETLLTEIISRLEPEPKS